MRRPRFIRFALVIALFALLSSTFFACSIVRSPNVVDSRRTATSTAASKELADEEVLAEPQPNIAASPIVESKAKMMVAAPPPPKPVMPNQQYLPQDGKDIDGQGAGQEFNTEQYNRIYENPFYEVGKTPLSTFSIDVDTASYSNTRRFLQSNQLPPPDAVRIEELINYFPTNDEGPGDAHPFAVRTETGPCPWAPTHQIVRVNLKGRPIAKQNVPPRNLVWLIDVSGSMQDPNKLPLLKNAFSLLVNELRPEDKVSLVVYAGAAGLVLPPTSGAQKQTILDALNRLEAGGSTAGGAGIELAYKVAQENFNANGINRVILATDGDFNVGSSSTGDLTRLIEEKRKTGVFLSTLGFGMGNYKDTNMEALADKGNGNYAYIDTISEARKVLVEEAGATLVTIAKDVKIQIEFNPQHVGAYRLIGYENRVLQDRDFNDDTKDAGEIGAGHTVTALYEIVPRSAMNGEGGSVDPLKYQQPAKSSAASDSVELMNIKLRYKQPTSDTSTLIEVPARKVERTLDKTSNDYRFSLAVASFGMLLRKSEHKGTASYEMVRSLAESGRGEDKEGYRAEFIRLVDTAASLSNLQR